MIMFEGKTVGVVVPAYNEERFIGRVIETLPDFVDRAYAVDDGSTDGTWDEILHHATVVNRQPSTQRHRTDGGSFSDRVVPIQHAENRGVGHAIKTGYLRALEDGIDATAVMDGDAQMDPDELERIVRPVVRGAADYSKGNRLLSREFRDEMPTWRFFGNSVLTLLTKIASGYWKMMDPQNGYTCISKRALETVGIEQMYGDYGYCNDLLVRLNANRMRIADVAMPAVYGDEESHINYTTSIRRVSLLLLRGFLWRMKIKYLVLDFHPLVLFYALGATVCAIGVFGRLWSLFAALVDGSPFFLRAVASLSTLTVGSLPLLFAMVFDMRVNEDREVQFTGEGEIGL